MTISTTSIWLKVRELHHLRKNSEVNCGDKASFNVIVKHITWENVEHRL